MAVEWGPDNVRVVGVSPGPIADTEANTFLGWSNYLSIADGCLIVYQPLRDFNFFHKRRSGISVKQIVC